ncbi:MAG: CinA family protein, partial [Anaerolineales bacterium]|nr:CinA family protein [Anaerolineales bacterium]
HRITNVPGSSEYYWGGIVAYSNEAKRNLLNVSQETLDRFGAVSEQTVTEMVRGVQELSGTQTAIAVSGIAGPGGGTPHKPVGTVWISVAVLDQITLHPYRFFGDREQIKNQSAEAALWLLVQRLMSAGSDPTIQSQVRAYQPIAVDYSGREFDAIQIHAIYWQEAWLRIESIGRRWQDADGCHWLAMNYQGKVFELWLKADGCWYLRPPRESIELA